jgi:site-specific DNA-methyltransferase (adenine-specific)
MLKPYYDQNGITLYHGDCSEVEVRCDLIVTDPPYGKNFKSNFGDWKKIVGDADEAEAKVNITRLIRHALRSLKDQRHIYIFGCNVDLQQLPLFGVTELIWDKVNIGMGNLELPWASQHEKILFAAYGHRIGPKAREKRGGLIARMRRGSIVRSLRRNADSAYNHPTEKPVDLLRQLIESSSVMGETVYDPFAGSGSTLIASRLEGRIAIGCEIEEKYCEIAVKRFNQELPQKCRAVCLNRIGIE